MAPFGSGFCCLVLQVLSLCCAWSLAFAGPSPNLLSPPLCLLPVRDRRVDNYVAPRNRTGARDDASWLRLLPVPAAERLAVQEAVSVYSSGTADVDITWSDFFSEPVSSFAEMVDAALLCAQQRILHSRGIGRNTTDRHHDQETQNPEPVRPSSPVIDMDPLPPDANCSPDRDFCGQSARGSADHGYPEPPEQPLDFSLKSAATSTCSSPLSSEDDRRPSPDDRVPLGVVSPLLHASNPMQSPEFHQRNPLLVIPRTTTSTNRSASTSPPGTFQNGYANPYGGPTSLPSPTASNLSSGSPAPPPLVRPPPQQPAFPSLQLPPPPVATSTSPPPPSASSTTGKYVRPFKAYQRGERLGMGLYSVSNPFLPAAPAAPAGFHLADPVAEAGFAAFRETWLRAGFGNGRQEHHRRSRTTGSASAAAGSAGQLATPSPMSNGAATCPAGSGDDDGDQTSPENSNSSILTVTNGDASTNGVVTANGDATTNGALTSTNGVAAASNGGSPNGGGASTSNGGGPIRNGRRRSRLPETEKDSAYWERRRKNNEAAKRSRDARRAKEDEIAIRAAFLEQENSRLVYEVAKLRAELNLLRQAMYANLVSQHHQQQ